MKYAIAWKEDIGDWHFMTRPPSKDFPFGFYYSGIWKFDTIEQAEAVRIDIVAKVHDGKEWPFVLEAKQDPWSASLRVVSIPDEALYKFDEVRRLTDECCAHPRDNVPAGRRENQLFHRGREIGAIGREGLRILLEHLNSVAV